ncbi:MAG: Holliday junction resolvase RuvX [Tepidanaerobacteraceae bacterium]|nr:Holliday junction resolvase RuvX [Tepidanaerobacter sp.]HQA60630.1 Holliday junction resolvase RuvX [Tepidanaerobacteraceae bacterium]HQE05987.1 Holliday junction resolvase RuvX [Tepidanaerobacteraceae bacterium]
MRILGLDIGEKRIGVAISDELYFSANGLDVIERKNNGEDINKIAEIVSRYNVVKIVVGLPKNMDGSVGPSGEEVKKYVNKLQNALEVEVDFWDERLSTVAAEKTLIEADISRKKRKKVIDKMAAVFILQNYLDFKSKVDSRKELL